MTQAPETCPSPDSISSKPGSNGDQAVNVALDPKALTYDWNGHKDLPISGAQYSDTEVASKVRMLSRAQLDHEAVCEMARDRIMALSKQVAALTASASEPEPVAYFAETGTAGTSDDCNKLFWRATGDDTVAYQLACDHVRTHGGYVKPLYAKPVPTPDGAVTDAMVEAALKAQHDYHHSREISYEPDGMRAALSAALSHPTVTKPDHSENTWKNLSEKGKNFSADAEQIVAAGGAVADAAELDGPLEREIDRLRLQAFKTNSSDDKASYYLAVSQWFQDRHFRALSHPADGWRSIESAPKDETLFLAACPPDANFPDGRVMIWKGSILAFQNDKTPDHLRFPATHWRPLPAAPLAAKPEGE